MLFFVEVMAPEWTSIRVYLVVALAVNAFEGIGAKFTLFGFKTRGLVLKLAL